MRRPHHFLPNSPPEIERKLLSQLGLSSVDELYSDVPQNVLMKRDLNLPRSMTEAQVERRVLEKLEKNKCGDDYLCFLGGGSWQGYVPAAVDEVISRSEFYTSYTPYQPEISQGMLQSLFEYQSLICDLTEMEVCNSSMYDWATALGEAGRMARRVTQRKKILVSESASPERLEVLKTYCLPAGMEIQRVSFDKRKGATRLQELGKFVNEEVAALYVENPNFLGIIEEAITEMGEKVHRVGGLFIVGIDPISLGILTPPGDYGADIVVGEGQPLGLYSNFGGPHIGIFATKMDSRLVRQMPGRLIGLTESIGDKKRSFCMVLQTREQHIRREMATSNICTNEALLALAAGVYLSLAGPKGLREICEKIMTNSHYLAKKISSIHRVSSPKFEGQFFREFVVDLGGDARIEEVQSKLLAEKIISGLPLERLYPSMRNSLLISSSEVHEREDLDRFASALNEVLS